MVAMIKSHEEGRIVLIKSHEESLRRFDSTARWEMDKLLCKEAKELKNAEMHKLKCVYCETFLRCDECDGCREMLKCKQCSWTFELDGE